MQLQQGGGIALVQNVLNRPFVLEYLGVGNAAPFLGIQPCMIPSAAAFTMDGYAAYAGTMSMEAYRRLSIQLVAMMSNQNHSTGELTSSPEEFHIPVAARIDYEHGYANIME